MEREELEKLKQDINKELEYMKTLRTKCDEFSKAHLSYSIAISNLYIALTNLIE